MLFSCTGFSVSCSLKFSDGSLSDFCQFLSPLLALNFTIRTDWMYLVCTISIGNTISLLNIRAAMGTEPVKKQNRI